MKKEYYREYYTFEREHWWFRARSEILAAQVEFLVGHARRPRILNVGAALGASSEMLARYGEVVSVEFEKDCCDFVRKQFGRTYVNASITALPFVAETFDLVCAFDVIEHVDDDDLAVHEMNRVCRSGGAIVVTVPAFMMLWSYHDEVNHHRRRYRLPELKGLFDSSGRQLYASYFNSLLFVPIVAVRTATKLVPQRWIRSGAGSDFTLVKSGVLDAIFYRMLRAENAWLRRGWTVPFGVSAFLSWRKE